MEYKKDLKRFTDKFFINKNGCWEWIGGTKGGGYGVFWLDGKIRGAHRVSLFLFKGLDINTKLLAIHSCDNPSCVNPDHLKYATQSDNMKDAQEKGRCVRVQDWRGCKNPKAKLTDEEIMLISSSQESASFLSEKYGVSTVRVYQIKKQAKKLGGGWAVDEF